MANKRQNSDVTSPTRKKSTSNVSGVFTDAEVALPDVSGTGEDLLVFVAGSDCCRHILNWTTLIERAPESCIRRMFSGMKHEPARSSIVSAPGWFVAQIAAWSQRFGPTRLYFPPERMAEAAEILSRAGWSDIGVNDVELDSALARLIYTMRGEEYDDDDDDNDNTTELELQIARKTIELFAELRPDLLAGFITPTEEAKLSLSNRCTSRDIAQKVCLLYQAFQTVATRAERAISVHQVMTDVRLETGELMRVIVQLDDSTDTLTHEPTHVSFNLWLVHYELLR